MTFVKLKPWVYWKPQPGEAVEGVFTGYLPMTSQAGERFDSVGIRGVDGSRWSCTRDKAVELFKTSYIVAGTTVRLTYLGPKPWKSNPEKFSHEFELEIG